MAELFNEPLFRKHLPSEMLNERRWMRYFLKLKGDGAFAKVPLGSHSDSSTWSTFDECVASLEPGKEQGLGYAFYGGEIMAVDLDHVRNPKTGVMCQEVMHIMDRLTPCWAEFSVSGKGLHILGYDSKGIRNRAEITETCLQFWPPAHSPRFFALTCHMFNEHQRFNTLGDWNGQLQNVLSNAKRHSSTIREELMVVDREQWESLPKEHEPVEAVTREKSKSKTRKVRPGFDIKDYIAFNKMTVINEDDNELGHCLRLSTCPNHNDNTPHSTHNDTTCNFIFPTKDGGLAYHCNSTGCHGQFGIHEAINKLAEFNGVYPKPIYQEVLEGKRTITLLDGDSIPKEHLKYLWQDYLPLKKLIHVAAVSGQGKSPLTVDLAARISSGAAWPDGKENTLGPRTVIMLSSEDDWADTVRPRLELAGADLKRIKFVRQTRVKDSSEVEIGFALKTDLDELIRVASQIDDLALVIIDPITNYLAGVKMNSEEEVREAMMPVVERFITPLRISVITVGHLNRRDKGTDTKARIMGAAAWYGIARFVYVCGPDDDSDSKYAHVLIQDRGIGAPSLMYETEAKEMTWDGETSQVIKVKWTGTCDTDGQSAVDPLTSAEKNLIAEDAEFLKQQLKHEAQIAKQVMAAHTEAFGRECTDWTRARRKAGVKTEKMRGRHSGWMWYLKGGPFPIKELSFEDDTELDGLTNVQ